MKIFKSELKNIVQDNTSDKGRVFDTVIQILILVSMLSFAFETFPDNSENTLLILHVIDAVCICVFSFEYLARIYVSQNRIKYIFSFFGLVDLLAIIPFFLVSTVDLRVLRIFRFFIIFRALKLIRYNRAFHRIHLAARIVREEVTLFLIITFIFVFLASAGIHYFEYEAQPEVFKSVFHSMWWAIVTLTTVGYGDVYPITVGGKVFTFFVLIIGVAIITIPAGLVASALSKAREIEEKERKRKREIMFQHFKDKDI